MSSCLALCCVVLVVLCSISVSCLMSYGPVFLECFFDYMEIAGDGEEEEEQEEQEEEEGEEDISVKPLSTTYMIELH